jgi:molybdopterin adenylyltransferase
MAKEKEKKRKMSSSTAEPRPLTAAVITVSDSCSRGERKDLSGPAVVELLRKLHFDVVVQQIVPDDQIQLQNLLIRFAREVRLIVTTGGTGIGPRDFTPEATVAVCEKLIDGMSEKMRSEGSKKTSHAALSRGVCGVRGCALILNLPGNPSGALDSLAAIAELLPHAIELLSGKTEHQ